MNQNWTFGRKLGLGFFAVVALTVVTGVISVYALRSVVLNKDQVIDVEAPKLVDVQELRNARNEEASALRAFLLTKNDRYLDELYETRSQFSSVLERLRGTVHFEEGKKYLSQIETAYKAHTDAVDGILALSKADTPLETVVLAFEEKMRPTRTVLEDRITDFVKFEDQVVKQARDASTQASANASYLIIGVVLGTVVVASILAYFLARLLSRQIGSAVGQVQSSAAELQAAANQQAAGAKEQATAMNEIATTINELLATARQIAESGQRVAHIARETADAAMSGGGTVEKSQDSIGGIRRQVEQIVNHMLDLGRKSQEIGAVLDIVSELAEQTNILAINATIEAAGAGETGRRFAVVADEIRKLADRVAGSTKEIRSLIEDVRSAVNTTVMATETGSKAVDSGSRQFIEVASSFQQISELVSTTSEAAREIELSTKQQTTAVEQVNVAITSVAQATKETETSSSQTLLTASQLADLSKGLLRLIVSDEHHEHASRPV
ncbi:MAG: methyl-accepting chemotaxis protein [Candidatus Hydrogenedentes bacterium]|nr:methyl-accepting chemotaxis protein [Candidatus Hydrogenedentota bacterium]